MSDKNQLDDMHEKYGGKYGTVYLRENILSAKAEKPSSITLPLLKDLQEKAPLFEGKQIDHLYKNATTSETIIIRKNTRTVKQATKTDPTQKQDTTQHVDFFYQDTEKPTYQVLRFSSTKDASSTLESRILTMSEVIDKRSLTNIIGALWKDGYKHTGKTEKNRTVFAVTDDTKTQVSVDQLHVPVTNKQGKESVIERDFLSISVRFDTKSLFEERDASRLLADLSQKLGITALNREDKGYQAIAEQVKKEAALGINPESGAHITR